MTANLPVELRVRTSGTGHYSADHKAVEDSNTKHRYRARTEFVDQSSRSRLHGTYIRSIRRVFAPLEPRTVAFFVDDPAEFGHCAKIVSYAPNGPPSRPHLCAGPARVT